MHSEAMSAEQSSKTAVNVGYLTPAGSRRRNRDGGAHTRHGSRCTLLILITALTSLTGAVETIRAADWQPAADIAAAAERFIHQEFGREDSHLEPKAGYLDPRLKLPRCDTTLQAFGRKGTRLGARTVVGVRCNGSRPWKVYVPVEVAIRKTVMVTRRSLPKGHLLMPGDLVAERRDVSRLRDAYLSTPESAAGQRLKHAVTGGTILKASMISADKIIRRGQMVTLVVDANAMNIRMAGKALMDGALNQRIRVENPASGRIVEGLVRSPEHVEVLVQ